MWEKITDRQRERERERESHNRGTDTANTDCKYHYEEGRIERMKQSKGWLRGNKE